MKKFLALCILLAVAAAEVHFKETFNGMYLFFPLFQFILLPLYSILCALCMFANND